MPKGSLEGESQQIIDDISVVIPTLGRHILRQCLDSIAKGCLLPRFVVVVDQSSNDEIRGWLDSLARLGVEVKHVASSQTGRAAGINRGLETLTSRYFVITDDDCQVAPDWLMNLHKHLDSSPGAVITGRVEPAGEQIVSMVATSLEPAWYNRPRLKYDSLNGPTIAASLATVQDVGLFDEDLTLRFSEDGEWAYRVLKAGVPIIYTPDVVVYHYGWRDADQRQEQYRGYARSHGAFYGKYLRQGDWFIAMRAIVHYLRVLRRLARGAISGDAEDVRIAWAYLLGLMPGMVAGFRSKSGIAGARLTDGN